MQYEVSGPFRAKELFELKPHIKKSIVVPVFLNQKAQLKKGWSKDTRFTGTGIYGIFLHGKLIYVGILTGGKRTLFSNSVIVERWKKHLTYFTLRSPACAATPQNIHRILRELEGEPIEAIAAMLGGRNFSLAEAKARKIGFVSGSSTQFNKVRFANENWEVFRPGNEEQMLDAISFVYARFMPETAEHLGAVSEKAVYDFVRTKWLEPREDRLVKRFQPICNKKTKVPKRDVDVATFLAALRQEMELSLPSFKPDGVPPVSPDKQAAA